PALPDVRRWGGQSSARGSGGRPKNFALCAFCQPWHYARSGLRMKNYLQLNFSLLYWIFVAPFTGQFFKIAPIFRQMVFIGVRAAPMVALTAFSVGVTLAMQAAHSLESLGAQMYIPDLVMLTLLREMGPVLIAVIVIGRSGSAVAAELGTMKVSEEIEALEVMAIDPVQFLVVPRFLAMMIMLPALTIFGNYIGILGGWAVCVFALDFNTAGYVLEALQSAEPWDLYSGMIKSVVFALIVITIACNAGLTVEGGAEGVGQATTTSVVQALLAMLVTNAVLTGIFFFVGCALGTDRYSREMALFESLAIAACSTTSHSMSIAAIRSLSWAAVAAARARYCDT